MRSVSLVSILTSTWAISCLSFAFLVGCSNTPARNTLRSESGENSKVEKEKTNGSDSKAGKGGDSTKDPDEASPSDKDKEKDTDIGTEPDPETPVVGIECAKSSVVSKAKFCESTVEGVAVKWVPLDNDEKPQRIALYLHGDTANDWRDPFVVTQFLSWAKKNKVLIVMSRSTTKYDDDGPDEWSYGAAQPEDARKLEKMLQTFITSYKTPSDNLLYFGVSGGPWFLSSSWIPLMAGKFPGLYALSCGGSQFWQKFAWDTKDSALRAKTKIFYNFGDKDFLAEAQELSIKHFSDAGIETSKKVHPGASHCSHDIYQPTIDFWEKNL